MGRAVPLRQWDREAEAVLRDPAATDADVRAVLGRAVGEKPDEHHSRVGTERAMSQIGG